jgi:soluble lytic murein transglycosylase
MNLQSLLRLTDDAELREKTLAELRKLYRTLPNYQKVPTFRLIAPSRQDTLKGNTPPVSDNRHKAISDELLFLDLFDEAAPEFDAGTQKDLRSSDLAYTLAVLYNRGDMADRAVAFAEPYWKTVPADYQIELIPSDQLNLLYPAPYVDAFLKSAPPRGIDPRFMLSIIRQESRYRPDVKSYAAARGLMQFISTTSEKIASELKRDNFRQEELYSPQMAILFGSQYISDLFAQFPNQPEAVAASYNGGDDNMRRWLGRSKSNLPDRYVPEIVFSQSKDYVQKVMANYRMYQISYDEKLTGR